MNKSKNVDKKARRVRNLSFEEVLPEIKGKTNLKKVPDIQYIVP